MCAAVRGIHSGRLGDREIGGGVPPRGPEPPTGADRIHAHRLRRRIRADRIRATWRTARRRALAGAGRPRHRGRSVALPGVGDHRRRAALAHPGRQSGVPHLHVGVDGHTQGRDHHPPWSRRLRGTGEGDVRHDARIPDPALRITEFRCVRPRTAVGDRRRSDDGDRTTVRIRRRRIGAVARNRAGHALLRHSGGTRVGRPRRTHRARVRRDRRGSVSARTGRPVGAGQAHVQRVRADRGNGRVEYQRPTGAGRSGHHRHTHPRLRRDRARLATAPGACRCRRGVVPRRSGPRTRLPPAVPAHRRTLRRRSVRTTGQPDIPHRGPGALAGRRSTGVPRAHRFPGEDPGLPDRTRRGRVGAAHPRLRGARGGERVERRRRRRPADRVRGARTRCGDRFAGSPRLRRRPVGVVHGSGRADGTRLASPDRSRKDRPHSPSGTRLHRVRKPAAADRDRGTSRRTVRGRARTGFGRRGRFVLLPRRRQHPVDPVGGPRTRRRCDPLSPRRIRPPNRRRTRRGRAIRPRRHRSRRVAGCRRRPPAADTGRALDVRAQRRTARQVLAGATAGDPRRSHSRGARRRRRGGTGPARHAPGTGVRGRHGRAACGFGTGGHPPGARRRGAGRRLHRTRRRRTRGRGRPPGPGRGPHGAGGLVRRPGRRRATARRGAPPRGRRCVLADSRRGPRFGGGPTPGRTHTCAAGSRNVDAAVVARPDRGRSNPDGRTRVVEEDPRRPRSADRFASPGSRDRRGRHRRHRHGRRAAGGDRRPAHHVARRIPRDGGRRPAHRGCPGADRLATGTRRRRLGRAAHPRRPRPRGADRPGRGPLPHRRMVHHRVSGAIGPHRTRCRRRPGRRHRGRAGDQGRQGTVARDPGSRHRLRTAALPGRRDVEGAPRIPLSAGQFQLSRAGDPLRRRRRLAAGGEHTRRHQEPRHARRVRDRHQRLRLRHRRRAPATGVVRVPDRCPPRDRGRGVRGTVAPCTGGTRRARGTTGRGRADTVRSSAGACEPAADRPLGEAVPGTAGRVVAVAAAVGVAVPCLAGRGVDGRLHGPTADRFRGRGRHGAPAGGRRRTTGSPREFAHRVRLRRRGTRADRSRRGGGAVEGGRSHHRRNRVGTCATARRGPQCPIRSRPATSAPPDAVPHRSKQFRPVDHEPPHRPRRLVDAAAGTGTAGPLRIGRRPGRIVSAALVPHVPGMGREPGREPFGPGLGTSTRRSRGADAGRAARVRGALRCAPRTRRRPALRDSRRARDDGRTRACHDEHGDPGRVGCAVVPVGLP
ncbi:Basic proline-rich protein precursor [Rhodococcus wratislaviensis]|uniref:Basic proline-rich protein n=1 Tax=Rhodococcus wratislaviensis TaxID=44752 RepID=A0A402CNB7_RHOWR|nr:Basic proline-rich protein precursor [Rhodococcus wratislaviensis]